MKILLLKYLKKVQVLEAEHIILNKILKTTENELESQRIWNNDYGFMNCSLDRNSSDQQTHCFPVAGSDQPEDRHDWDEEENVEDK